MQFDVKDRSILDYLSMTVTNKEDKNKEIFDVKRFHI